MSAAYLNAVVVPVGLGIVLGALLGGEPGAFDALIGLTNGLLVPVHGATSRAWRTRGLGPVAAVVIPVPGSVLAKAARGRPVRRRDGLVSW